MSDYKALFYKSQAKIADLNEQLDKLTSDLKRFMQFCEEAIIESNDLETSAENN